MDTTGNTPEQLAAENEDLRNRLEEAEETLRAIRSGEVDALVVSGAGGEQLFTLKGADQSYRILVEEMSEGAVSMAQDGVIYYANRCLAGILKTQLEAIAGSTVYTWLAPDSRQMLRALLDKGTNEARRAELVLIASDGTQVPVYVSVSKLPIGEMPDSFCMTVPT